MMGKRGNRRDKFKLYGELLTIISQESDKEKLVLTKLQNRLNVPYDRFKLYLLELKRLELVEDESSLKLTKKGQAFLCEYRRIRDFLNRIGLGEQF
jgi:predicted transcriptional regulator